MNRELSFRLEKRNFLMIRAVKQESAQRHSTLFEADKTGCFPFLPCLDFLSKLEDRLSDLFQPFVGNLAVTKKKTYALLEEAEFAHVSRAVTKEGCDAFSVKFWLKDHKMNLPPRVVLKKEVLGRSWFPTFYNSVWVTSALRTL